MGVKISIYEFGGTQIFSLYIAVPFTEMGNVCRDGNPGEGARWGEKNLGLIFGYANFKISMRNPRAVSGYETGIQEKVGAEDIWEVSAYRLYLKQ